MTTTQVNPARLPVYSAIEEPRLAFSPDQTDQRDTHPLRGLARYGPYSSAAFAAYTPTIRVATVGPAGGSAQVRELLGSICRAHPQQDRRDYVPAFPGFAAVFGVELRPAPDPTHISWPDTLDALPGDTATDRVRRALSEALRRLAAARNEFDIVTVHLPDNWAAGTRTDDFDAHDTLKVLGALAGIPTQVINDRTFAFPYRNSVAWRLSIAAYVKAGGVPWKLAPLAGVPDDTAYIGLAYALRGDPREARFVTCCSQVFDADGGGMQFVAFEAGDPVADVEDARRNPYLSRRDMRAVMLRSLRLYQSRNGGGVPRRIVVFKQTGFRDEEIAGVDDAFAAINEVECVEVTTNVAWRGVWLRSSRRTDRRTEPDGYPVHRGVTVHTSGTSALLWAAGDAPAVALQGGHYYQGGKSIPRPLLITRHAGAGPLELTALETLAMTKMDWNNDALYDPIPVTIAYAQRLARIIASDASLPGNAYPYRMFM